MTHKEIAERLRTKVTDHYDAVRLADELDPQRPEPGTVVWWARLNDTGRHYLGIVADGGDGVIDSEQEFHEWCYIEYKPARILGPDEVAVKVRPVREWPENAGAVNIWAQYTDGLRGEVLKRITRAEAMRMEAER